MSLTATAKMYLAETASPTEHTEQEEEQVHACAYTRTHARTHAHTHNVFQGKNAASFK